MSIKQMDTQFLVNCGWSSEGAKFLMNCDPDETAYLFRRLLKQRAPRKKTKRFKVAIPICLRWEIWERDNFTCLHCGVRNNLSIDHIIPESKGGALEPTNLQTLCNSCNSRKGSKMPQAQ